MYLCFLHNPYSIGFDYIEKGVFLPSIIDEDGDGATGWRGKDKLGTALLDPSPTTYSSGKRIRCFLESAVVVAAHYNSGFKETTDGMWIGSAVGGATGWRGKDKLGTALFDSSPTTDSSGKRIRCFLESVVVVAAHYKRT